MIKTGKQLYEDHFFFKSDEIVTGNLTVLKKHRVLTKQASVDIPDGGGSAVRNNQPPTKKHRLSESFVADETSTTQFVDAESTIQKSAIVKSVKKKQRKSKLATSDAKKMKKKQSKSDQFKEHKVNLTAAFQPRDADLKSENVKFTKDDEVNPFYCKKPKTPSAAANVENLPVNNDKKLAKTIEKKPTCKGKIGELKTLFDNLAKKTKEKLKVGQIKITTPAANL